MSNTYKHKKWGVMHSLQKKHGFYDGWEKYEANPTYGSLLDYGGFSNNPSWWNHDFSTIPSRRKQNNLLRKINLDNCEDYWDFPDYKKPYIYYW